MIFIYNCYGGTHSSSLAAAIHLRRLSADRIPEKEEILRVQYFNTLKTKDMGKIIFRGTDEDGNKVFTLGRGSSKVLLPCLENLINLLHTECGFSDRIILSNTSPAVPLAMTLGGLFSRRLGIHFIGVPLLICGAKKSHPRIVEIVERTKQLAKASKEPVLMLENKGKSVWDAYTSGG